jgi:hypothetical protein
MKHSSLIATTAIVVLAAMGAAAPGASGAGLTASQSPYHVSLKASTTQAIAGETQVKLTGQVIPQPPEASKVLVQVQYEHQDTWIKLGTATVKANGTYKFVTTPKSRKDLVYRVVKTTDKVAKQDLSPERGVKVQGWVYLTLMKTSAGEGVTAGTLPINGDNYQQSLYTPTTVTSGFVEYTLGHHSTLLDTTFGLSDRTETGGKAAIRLTADGVAKYERTFDLGVSDHQVLDVTDAYRIRISFAQVSGTPATEPAAGSARVLTD